jgi:hypothetical protein
MKSLVAVALAAVSLLAVVPSWADGPEQAALVQRSAPGVLVLADRTIYGRPNRPMVVIDVRPLSAAAAAGAAHEGLRTNLVNALEPAAMRH